MLNTLEINLALKPEYRWTIIIIQGETVRQMVQTMQITTVACAPPCTCVHAQCARTTVHALSGYFRFWGTAAITVLAEKPAVVTCAVLHGRLGTRSKTLFCLLALPSPSVILLLSSLCGHRLVQNWTCLTQHGPRHAVKTKILPAQSCYILHTNTIRDGGSTTL